MKKLLVLLLVAQLSVAHADWDDPSTPFDATKNQYKSVNLSWVITNDIQKTCASEMSKRGLGKLTWEVDACSFWNGNVCTIYTKKRPNMHSVGHEVRHCFQGNWH
jgi:hypothetical protein